jgi:hypothetical protein
VEKRDDDTVVEVAVVDFAVVSLVAVVVVSVETLRVGSVVELLCSELELAVESVASLAAATSDAKSPRAAVEDDNEVLSSVELALVFPELTVPSKAAAAVMEEVTCIVFTQPLPSNPLTSRAATPDQAPAG